MDDKIKKLFITNSSEARHLQLLVSFDDVTNYMLSLLDEQLKFTVARKKIESLKELEDAQETYESLTNELSKFCSIMSLQRAYLLGYIAAARILIVENMTIAQQEHMHKKLDKVRVIFEAQRKFATANSFIFVDLVNSVRMNLRYKK